MIVVDSTDPVGPAVGLFSKEFYQSAYEALAEDGILVAQTESPFFNADLISSVYKAIGSIFPIVKPYTACVPTYPGGFWCFTLGSKKYDPKAVNIADIPQLGTKYYTPEIHKASFVLPKFLQDIIKG